jgi:hypothetical protein
MNGPAASEAIRVLAAQLGANSTLSRTDTITVAVVGVCTECSPCEPLDS